MILNTPTDKVFTFLSTDLSCSSGCLSLWPEWPEAPPEPCPKVLAVKVPDMVVADRLGLEGPNLAEDPWPWFVLLWSLEDWLPPECPYPPWSLGMEALDSA